MSPNILFISSRRSWEVLEKGEGSTGESIVELEEEGTYPNIEFNIFIRYCFDVEADCGDCSYRLIEFEFIQYRWGLGGLFLMSEKYNERGRGKKSEGMGGWTD